MCLKKLQFLIEKSLPTHKNHTSANNAMDSPDIGVMYFSNHSVLIRLNPKYIKMTTVTMVKTVANKNVAINKNM